MFNRLHCISYRLIYRYCMRLASVAVLNNSETTRLCKMAEYDDEIPGPNVCTHTPIFARCAFPFIFSNFTWLRAFSSSSIEGIWPALFLGGISLCRGFDAPRSSRPRSKGLLYKHRIRGSSEYLRSCIRATLRRLEYSQIPQRLSPRIRLER